MGCAHWSPVEARLQTDSVRERGGKRVRVRERQRGAERGREGEREREGLGARLKM